MKTILFCNSSEPACGVYQYGCQLYDALDTSDKFEFSYYQPGGLEEMAADLVEYDAAAVIYNWHPDMGGWMKGAPFPGMPAKQILVYHDWEPDVSKFDAVLFSDPTMSDHDNWHSIPRPLPVYDSGKLIGRGGEPIIGVHGFFGASADLVLKRVMEEFDRAILRMHIPFAFFGDRDGKASKEMAARCMAMLEDKPEICATYSHRWLDARDLLGWLSYNDLNCYLRDTTGVWRGVSSALDAALAVRRPLAVNKCQGFRHVFGCQPSVCVEERSLKEILATGIEPLKPLYEANSREKLVARVESILEGIGL